MNHLLDLGASEEDQDHDSDRFTTASASAGAVVFPASFGVTSPAGESTIGPTYCSMKSRISVGLATIASDSSASARACRNAATGLRKACRFLDTGDNPRRAVCDSGRSSRPEGFRMIHPARKVQFSIGRGVQERSLGIAPLIGLGCFLMLACGCRVRDTPVIAQFVTGQEQEVIDKLAAPASKKLTASGFPNELDHAMRAMFDRADPKPSPHQLARGAVVAMFEEFQHHTDRDSSPETVQQWCQIVSRTGRFGRLLEHLEGNDPSPVYREQLIRAGLVGMLGSIGLGPEWLLEGQRAREMRRILESRTDRAEPGMIGVELDQWPKLRVRHDSPAFDAGLRNGDTVIRVDGRDAGSITSTAQAAASIGGPAGQTVKIAIVRDGQTLELEVRRMSMAAGRITARQVEPDLLLVRIPTFEGSGITERVQAILHKHQSSRSLRVILDLRDNPGGRPEPANGVASLFLQQGERLQLMRFRNGRLIAFQSAPGHVRARALVLMNRSTGSAAEMLILALRHRRGTVLFGERTAGVLFGKDCEDLGRNMLLFRSEPTILSPQGQDFSITGIPPDVAVEDQRTGGRDAVLLRALEFLRHPPSRPVP